MADRKQSLKVWVGGGSTAVVLLAVLAWIMVIGPQLSAVSATKAQTADAQSQNFVLEHKVNKLKADSGQLAALTTKLAAARTELPSDSGMPDYIRQLLAQANKVGVTVTSVAAGTPTAVAGGTAAPIAAGTNPTGHLFAIPVNLVSTGTLASQRQLMHAIQAVGPRRALVTKLDFSPIGTGNDTAAPSIDGGSTMTATMQVFVAPQNPAAEAALLKQLTRAGG